MLTAEALAPAQIPGEQLPDRVWDVAILGAGPAGCMAAIRLGELGRQVVLVDRHEFPREKTCGDGLIPDAMRALAAAGLADRVKALGHSVAELSVYSPAGIRVDLPGDFTVLRREMLDAILAGEAVNRGATFCQARAATLDEDGRTGVIVQLAKPAGRLRARFGVVATGAEVSLLTRLGLLERQRPGGFAARRYVRSCLRLDRMIISFDRAVLPGYAWIFPTGNGEFNVGCGIFGASPGNLDLGRMFRSFTESFPLARELLANGEFTTRLKGAPLRSGLARAPGGGRILAVGEASGTTYPFTGEGIGKAMESGWIAAELLDDVLDTGAGDPLQRYVQRLSNELGPKYLGYETAQRWIRWPRLVDMVAWRMARNAALRSAATGVVDESVDPRAVFSVRELLRPARR